MIWPFKTHGTIRFWTFNAKRLKLLRLQGCPYLSRGSMMLSSTTSLMRQQAERYD